MIRNLILKGSLPEYLGTSVDEGLGSHALEYRATSTEEKIKQQESEDGTVPLQVSEVDSCATGG